MSLKGRGFSLIEILVVVAILAVLAAFLLPNYLGGAKDARGRRVESPIQRAHSTECTNNLQQIRLAYQAALASDDTNKPQSLEELKSQGVMDSMLKCPVGGQSYQFDPATGKAWCPNPGHESY